MKILHVAKAALYGLFLNYYCYYTITGSFLPGGTVLFLALGMACVGLDILQRGHMHIETEVWIWMLYGLVALITTPLATMSSSTSYISDIIKYIQRVAIIFMVAYICQREESIRFGLRLMAVTAVASAAAIFSVLGDINRKLDITSGANLSANDIGAIMAFGCFALIFAWGRRRSSSILLSGLKTAGVILCVTVIFLAGSRKSIGAVALMLAVLLALCLPDYGRRVSPKKFLSVLFIGLVAWLFIREYLLPYAEQTNLYDRLFGDNAAGASESDQVRVQLYRWAMEDFLNNPLLGVGFNQFRHLHGNYTHSTYAEPLACSGFIGLLYLYPYYLIIRKQLRLIAANRPGTYARLKQKEMLAYLTMFLFVAVGIPYMYKDTPCIILGTLVAHQTISFRQLRQSGISSGEY